MWGLGPPNKRIRVTNAMLANSRRLSRESCAGVRSKKAVFSFFSPELDTQYCTHFVSMFSKIDVYRSTH